MNRRNWLKNIGALSAFSGLPVLQTLAQDLIEPEKKHVLRIAHMTDMHIKDNVEIQKQFAHCLQHIQQLDRLPDFIFNGGDAINDALFHSKSSVKKQWKSWHSVVANDCGLEMKHCVGNHDIWGMVTKKSDPLYGKKFAMEMMGINETYKSFDQNGWHFIILDSTQERSSGIWYTAKLGDEQLNWLEEDLKKVPADMPVLILSHIPILTASVFLDSYKVRFGKFQIPGTWMHLDVKEIMAVLNKFPNVKLCLSGHIHLYDHVQYNHISFYCNGAVSGDWWKHTTYHETPAGYAIVDLFSDGSFTNTYMSYLL